MTNDSILQKTILQTMADGRIHNLDWLRDHLDSRQSKTEIKEALLELLKVGAVYFYGTRWKIAEQATLGNDIFSQNDNLSEGAGVGSLYVVCPGCGEYLEIIADYIGKKVECQRCVTKFLISTRKLSADEHEAYSIAENKQEEATQ